MAAKALLNVAALRFVSSRSLLRGTASVMAATTSYNRSLFRGKLPLSCFARPVRRTFCVRATTEADNSASFESPLMESMEKKVSAFRYLLLLGFSFNSNDYWAKVFLNSQARRSSG